MMSAGLASSFGFVDIASITVDEIYHVTFLVGDNSRILGSNEI